MTGRDLQPLLAPRSVAVIGASPSSRVGLNMVRNLQQLGYERGADHLPTWGRFNLGLRVLWYRSQFAAR